MSLENRGYKKVLLIFPDYKGGHFGALRPPAGLGYISAALKKSSIEHDVIDMAVGSTEEELTERIASLKPDLIGISLMSFMYLRSYEIVRVAKRSAPDAKVVAGGPHTSTVKEDVLKGCSEIDFGVMMEGEDTIVELCAGKPLADIKGLLYRDGGKIINNGKRDFIEVLDDTDFPRYEKFDIDKYVTEEIGVITSRGCPFQCTYCPVLEAIGRKWRKRSAKSVVDEIEYWHSRGKKQISILDDNFTLKRDRVEAICGEIEKRNLTGLDINCNNGIRADRVDYDLLKLMKDAGFNSVAFGVEGGNDKILANIKKGEKLESIEKGIETAVTLGYKVTLFFIVGTPGETLEDVEDSIKIARKYDIFDARFYNLIPFPETELYGYIKQNNLFLIKSEDYLNQSSQWGSTPVFETPEMPKADRIKALERVEVVRKEILERAMERRLKTKFGIFARPISKVYVTDFAQELLMKYSFVRKPMKRLYMMFSSQS